MTTRRSSDAEGGAARAGGPGTVVDLTVISTARLPSIAGAVPWAMYVFQKRHDPNSAQVSADTPTAACSPGPTTAMLTTTPVETFNVESPTIMRHQDYDPRAVLLVVACDGPKNVALPSVSEDARGAHRAAGHGAVAIAKEKPGAGPSTPGLRPARPTCGA